MLKIAGIMKVVLDLDEWDREVFAWERSFQLNLHYLILIEANSGQFDPSDYFTISMLLRQSVK